jgi:putative pyruvate formate lyase activating enzyme
MSAYFKYSHLLKSCTLCPHKCRVNRLENSKGFCHASDIMEISSVLAHYGEEPPISGDKGSGTVFFKYCNMRCVYCQNFQISQESSHISLKNEDNNSLEESMLKLQSMGCHNINLVSPTIWIFHIIDALRSVRTMENGLSIPVVFNSGGYEDPETVKLLDGMIEIYMPDMRYGRDESAFKYSGVKNYVENNRKSLIEMYRQVGGLKTDNKGIAVRGLMVRLLIFPENVNEIKESLDFIKNELSTDVYISIMAQYQPMYKAFNYPEINRQIIRDEYERVVDYVEKLGFYNGAIQEFEEHVKGKDFFIPDFDNKEVFKFKKGIT